MTDKENVLRLIKQGNSEKESNLPSLVRRSGLSQDRVWELLQELLREKRIWGCGGLFYRPV